MMMGDYLSASLRYGSLQRGNGMLQGRGHLVEGIEEPLFWELIIWELTGKLRESTGAGLRGEEGR